MNKDCMINIYRVTEFQDHIMNSLLVLITIAMLIFIIGSIVFICNEIKKGK